MTIALQITVLVVLCFGIPLAFLAMIRAHATDAPVPPDLDSDALWLSMFVPPGAKLYDPDYIAALVAKAAPAFADYEEDNQPVVRRFNKDGANVPPSGLHKPERVADLHAISGELLEVSL